MATVRYRFSCWIGVLLLLSSFHNGDCQRGPNTQRCDCGVTEFSGSSGTVTSPYYPNDYRNNCRCKYTITVTSPNRIRLQFHSIDFGDGPCLQDYIRVFDGQDTFSMMIAWFCSNRNTPTSVTSKTQNLIIWFRSDSRRVGGGFRATYSIISPTTDAPTTHITTLPTTHTTPSTTRVTTPLMTSTAKSTSVSTSTLAATTKKDATIPITRETLSKSSKGPQVISTTSTTSVTFQNINEMISTALDNISTTDAPTLSTKYVLKKQAQSSLLRYAWILPITIIVILVVLAVFLLCFVKRRRSGKTSKVNGNRGTTDSIPPDALAADGTTVIVNQTYQSNDDFIPDIVYQPIGDDVVNGNTVKTERNNTGAVESKSDLDSQTSPVYQTTKNSESDPEVTAHNYDLLGDKSPSGDVYQSSGDSAYQYADFDKSEYQYAGRTPRYDYAEASTLPVSSKYTAKANTPATYEALNPLDREPDASIHERNTFTENVAYATAGPVQSSRYMGLEEVANKPYQGLVMTTGEEFAENPAYSGVEMDEGYLYPDVSKMDGKEFSQEAGYDQVSVGVYASVGETSKNESNLNSIERSGTLPNSDAYDVVNVNSEDTLTKAQQSGKFKNDDVVIGDTYETLNYRDPSEMNLSYNETGYIDYKASGTSSYQPLKTNVNSLFGLKAHRR